jgi:hypothetical protein
MNERDGGDCNQRGDDQHECVAAAEQRLSGKRW